MTACGPATLALVNPDMMAGCAAWRIIWPFSLLARRGYRVGYGAVGDPHIAGQIQFADVVVAQRLEWDVGDEKKAHAWVDLLHQGGKCLVYETDDDLYGDDSIERIRETSQPGLADRPQAVMERELEARRFALSVADGVTVSTPALAAVVRRYTQAPVTVVPNAIDLPRFMAQIEAAGITKLGPVTVGWAGGNRPDADAAQLAIAWGRLAKRYPDLRFVVGGFTLRPLIDAVPANRLTIVPKRPINAYAATYAAMDILCCPLEANVFNASKSPIKALEGAAAGCAVVASPTVYGDLIEHRVTGAIADGADQWEAEISHLIERPDVRRACARALLRVVERDHSLAGTVHRWPTAWGALAADFRLRAFRGQPPVGARATSLIGGADA